MMKSRVGLLVFSLIITLVILACGLSGSMDVVDDSSNNETTDNSGNQNGSGLAPTDTDTFIPPPEDTATPTNPPEDTQIPSATTICDLVSFVSDITVPDGSKADPGEHFTKTWRLRNAGSCTWTSGYDLVFVSGDAMGAPPAVQVTGGVVNPNDTVDVSVSLIAPNSPGTYKGYYKLRNSSAVIFGLAGNNPFWVEIEVKSPAPPPAAQKPDLIITSIVLTPPTPTKGDPVQVKVSTYNIGNAVSGPYHVEWWASKNAPSPACEWDVTNSNPNGGRVLSCTYPGYPSWYSSLDTKAVVDSLDTVDESNESNNTLLLNISVNP